MAAHIGTAASRIDGRAKVTGAAKYAAEFNVRGLAHAALVTSAVANGRILRIDASRALAVDGVIDVLTHRNRPPMASDDSAYKDDVAPEGSPYRPLYDDRIAFSGQPVALVVADAPETARHAAALVRIDYARERHVTDIHRRRDAAVALRSPAKPEENEFAPPRARGNADQALAAAAVRHEAEYSTPIEHHNPLELYASTVVFEADGRLTVYDKTQGVQNVQRYLCGVLGLAPDWVIVLSPFVGGAFGSGLRPQFQVVLAALAALHLKRAVRLVLSRRQMYALGYRPAMIQQIDIGAKADGTLAGIKHDAVTVTSRYESFYRQETGWSGLLYTCANAGYRHRLARLDLPTSCDMRAPSAATGVYALECAMDELAVALQCDPLDLRLRCYSDRDQHRDRPYSSKRLRDCYIRGAQAFGWQRRRPTPRSMRDGSDLIGWGMASGVWEALQVPIAVRIALTANGHAEVSCATSDIGTGTYTIMAQVAADMLGLPIDNVSIRLGDSRLPQSPVEGGSWTAASLSNGIAATAAAVREALLGLAQGLPNSPLAIATPDEVALADGKLVHKRDASRAVPIAQAMRHGGVDRISEERLTTFDDDGSQAHNTHSAVFAEVRVDDQLGVIRVTRIVSAVAAGRILNTKTARSQIIGGIVWGIGMALHEETLVDHAFGRVVNADIAEYHVPVNADVGDIDVIFVEEADGDVNPLGVKGVGEIGMVGVAAAIANAVHHATGRRVRDLPITLDKLRRRDAAAEGGR
ncbi:MAG TPA: xanthine dehydrogenase family protein molybdopterin-binding subunit [Stellaceae bacterium]|nr:xanthine dehydrogenase family protein molybdopterin-binding subunit [Stellaceae bacterium]